MRRSAIVLVLVVAAALAAAGPASASAPRIVGGAPVSFAASPWSVGILSAYVSNRYEAQLCGGTLIAPNTVLTAAHCLYDRDGAMAGADDIDVLSGTSLLLGSLGDRSPVIGGVVSGLHQDMWDPDDVAVLWVAHTSPLAVPLPPATFAQEAAFRTGSRVTMAGWGANRVAHRRAWFPRKLKQYAGIVRAKARGFLLIRSLTSSACFGDSGAAAVGLDVSGAPYLVGVVHAGRLDCATGKAVMFVNVAGQQAFIQAALAAGPPVDDESAASALRVAR
jgi:secreted trypsin-like serine protease